MRLLRTTTEDITRTWLLPEMVERIASMLDYFLDHLAGRDAAADRSCTPASQTAVNGMAWHGMAQQEHAGERNAPSSSAVSPRILQPVTICVPGGGLTLTKITTSDPPALMGCTGKQKRKNLRVREPEKYRWKPAELLAQLAHIYLNLSSADASGGFVAAIAADQRSYHEGLFSDAADVRCSSPSCSAWMHAFCSLDVRAMADEHGSFSCARASSV